MPLRWEPLFESHRLRLLDSHQLLSGASGALSAAALAAVLKVHFYFAFKWLEMQMRAALLVGGETDPGPGAAHSEGKVRCRVGRREDGVVPTPPLSLFT